jgi:hypothetical protein
MRSFTFVAALVGAACSVLPLSAASAQPLGQDLAITTIQKSSFSGQQQPLRLVISNDADYKSFFNGQPPSSPTVDFSSEDVLVASNGFRPTGGYSIEITRVQVNVGPSAIVSVHETTPPPGTMVPMIVTSPMHVVKVARRASSYTFQNVGSATPAAAPFDKLTFTYIGGFVAFQETITVDKNGLVTVDRRPVSAPIPATSYHGQATAAEMKAIVDGFNGSDFATLPATIQPTHIIPDVPSLKIEAKQGSTKNATTLQSAASYGAYEARLKPLVDAVTTAADRIVQANSVQQVTGKVKLVTPAGSSTLMVGSVFIPTSSSFSSILLSQLGKTVTIKAIVTQVNGQDMADVQSIVGKANRTVALRAHPRSTASVRETLSAGDEVDVLGLSTPNGYYWKATAANQSGWVYKSAVTIGF